MSVPEPVTDVPTRPNSPTVEVDRSTGKVVGYGADIILDRSVQLNSSVELLKDWTGDINMLKLNALVTEMEPVAQLDLLKVSVDCDGFAFVDVVVHTHLGWWYRNKETHEQVMDEREPAYDVLDIEVRMQRMFVDAVKQCVPVPVNEADEDGDER